MGLSHCRTTFRTEGHYSKAQLTNVLEIAVKLLWWVCSVAAASPSAINLHKQCIQVGGTCGVFSWKHNRVEEEWKYVLSWQCLNANLWFISVKGRYTQKLQKNIFQYSPSHTCRYSQHYKLMWQQHLFPNKLSKPGQMKLQLPYCKSSLLNQIGLDVRRTIPEPKVSISRHKPCRNVSQHDAEPVAVCSL